jgi:hypothetical protein
MTMKLTSRLERLEQAAPKLPYLGLESFSPEESAELKRRHAESGDPGELLIIQTTIIDPPARPDDDRPALREPVSEPEPLPTTSIQPSVSGFDRYIDDLLPRPRPYG